MGQNRKTEIYTIPTEKKTEEQIMISDKIKNKTIIVIKKYLSLVVFLTSLHIPRCSCCVYAQNLLSLLDTQNLDRS